MRTCEKCQVEKNEAQFRPFGRGRKKACRACEGLAEGEAVIAARPGLPVAVAEPGAPVRLQASLEIPAGSGFRAAIEDDLLQIEQDRSDESGTYTHQLTLNRVEAARLIDWISRLVEREAA